MNIANAEIAGSRLQRAGHSVRGLANWILDYADELGFSVSNMALNKLVFFAFEQVLLQSGKILTNAKIEAWEHGPVFREVYHSFKQHGDSKINTRAKYYAADSDTMQYAEVKLDNETELLLRDELKPLLPLSASHLREISHEENGAWYRVWWHAGQANPGMEITPEAILQSQGERSH